MIRTKSMRAFIGAQNYLESLNFYDALGFNCIEVGPRLTYCRVEEQFGFYLQNSYVKDWVDNTMLFWEVEDVEISFNRIQKLDLKSTFPQVRLSKIHYNDWGREFFLHDPSGVLWHIGNFDKLG